MTEMTHISYVRFTLIFVGVTILIGVLAYVADAYLQMTIPSSGLSIIAPMLAAMDAGQQYARATHDKPGSAMAWRAAGKMALIVVVISAPISLWIFYSVIAADAAVELSRMLAITGGIFLFLGLVFWVMNRVFFSMGANNELKAIARKNRP